MRNSINEIMQGHRRTYIEQKAWVHPMTIKAMERFKRPIPDYGKKECRNENR